MAKKSNTASDGKTYWNGWSSNYIHAEQGYRVHAFVEDGSGRAICGAPIHEGGGMSIPSETVPGCISCRRILRKRGVITK